jgi:hypothetical protein
MLPSSGPFNSHTLFRTKFCNEKILQRACVAKSVSRRLGRWQSNYSSGEDSRYFESESERSKVSNAGKMLFRLLFWNV